MANYWEQLFSDIFDPGGIFHDTKSKKESDAQWLANYQLQQRALLDQEAAFQYQQQYDKWQQDFATKNQQFSQDAFNRQQDFNEQAFSQQMAFNKNSFREQMDFNKDSFAQQMALAQSPVSTVVNDAAKVGVNPMAALGMSAGSASAGSVSPASASPTNGSYSDPNAPNSNARGSFGAGSLGQTGLLNSMVSALGSVGSAHISANQSDKESKRNAALRQQELDIIREKNRNDFVLGNRSADIAQQNANSQSTSVTGDLKIRQQLANANDRMSDLEFKKFAHNEMMDYRDLLLRQTQFNRSIYEDDRNYNQRVSEFNRQYDRLVAEFEGKIKNASKDRRMEYITRFSSNVARIASSLLGGGASFGDFFGSHSSTIGFQP